MILANLPFQWDLNWLPFRINQDQIFGGIVPMEEQATLKKMQAPVLPFLSEPSSPLISTVGLLFKLQP